MSIAYSMYFRNAYKHYWQRLKKNLNRLVDFSSYWNIANIRYILYNDFRTQCNVIKQISVSENIYNYVVVIFIIHVSKHFKLHNTTRTVSFRTSTCHPELFIKRFRCLQTYTTDHQSAFAFKDISSYIHNNPFITLSLK